MRLTDILLPSCVKVPLSAQDKQAAIFELVDLLADEVGLEERDPLKAAVWERETTRTTGIGHGIAIPHGKTTGCQRIMMAIGKPAAPIDFGAIDNRPVELIVLLASPAGQSGPHIQALATVSHMLVSDDVRAAFHRAASADEVFDLVRRYEPRM